MHIIKIIIIPNVINNINFYIIPIFNGIMIVNFYMLQYGLSYLDDFNQTIINIINDYRLLYTIILYHILYIKINRNI